ncbi:MAG: deoxyribodipyrimidine photo-lyase [Candidatus Zixiibacteriota bacterium]|nr:MAG: deoxyribodipyrimidine photo-lyase [candidate division Zixibacteria bacterium]
MIHQERVKLLNKEDPKAGRYVLYWMQASQRTEYNHALEYSILRANEAKKPVVVCFGLTEKFPEANLRHYAFMLEGLKEVKSALERRGIKMIVRRESPERTVLRLAGEASLVVTDRGYLRIQRYWRGLASSRLHCPLIQVESDVVVPVEEASPKEEYSAATFRPKIKRKLGNYLIPLGRNRPKIDASSLHLDSLEIDDWSRILDGLKLDRSVSRVEVFHGGNREARRHLRRFIAKKLRHFAELRNDPTADNLSNMSPYLHFGQISPLYIALQVMKAESPGLEAYMDELLVRRELSMNFAFYNSDYDSFDALPEWARKTLREHRRDKRKHVYSLAQLESARTHDPYWNAAQDELRMAGKMHGYMRMYWGKKILEWSKTPEEAFHVAVHLNNKYELDGRDPNGFAGVAWCFGKHDRPWGERPIFGKVRYMAASGLERKFNVRSYVQKIDKLKERFG